MANRNPNYKEDAKKGGRPKGVQNKITLDLKKMVLEALEKKGGVKYLANQAEKNPTAFISLLGKCMSKDIKVGGDGDNPIIAEIVLRSVKADN